ncbi:hypothetical protein AB205_0084280, partial [Aquarana catesbeiana]
MTMDASLTDWDRVYNSLTVQVPSGVKTSHQHSEAESHQIIFTSLYARSPSPVLGEPETIDWYSPQGEKITSNQRVVVQREGIRSWLTIYNANIDDAGIYRCQAIDSKGHTQESTVVLEIYQKLTFEDVRSPQEFRKGEDAEVICHINSSPAPMVRWLNNGEDVTDIDDSRFAMLANNNLQIMNISKKDEGIYRCEGRVEVRGEIDFRDIFVIVN